MTSGLTDGELRDRLAPLRQELAGDRVLVLVPDLTRSAPVPRTLRLLGEVLERWDVLVALGTHQPLPPDRLATLTGPVPDGVTVHQHAWGDPEAYAVLGEIPAAEVAELSGGLLEVPVPVRLNRLVTGYDTVLVAGPVFPHEVVGFSGGNKYFVPGVAGPEVIDVTHWLGALLTSRDIIGVPGVTPVRAMIDRAAALVPARRRCLAYVVGFGDGPPVEGAWVGTPEVAWKAAAELAARTHVRYLDRPCSRVLSLVSTRYDDLWTAAKGVYKVEPVVADGGEVVLYAPHVTAFSVTHGELLAEVGFHTRDYFLADWERWRAVPWAVLAHSTHVTGAGTMDPVAGERPRMRVTLATGIPAEACRAHNLGYRDPATVDPDGWAADPDTLVVPEAGEILFRLRP
jgi:lactate racemase